MSGDLASPPRPAVGVPYGEGERRLEAQRRTPVPVKTGQPGIEAPAGGGAGGGATTDPYAQAIEQLQGMAAPTNLMQMPTRRPNETLMTGAGQRPAPGGVYDDGLFEFREFVRAYPYPDLQDMLSILQSLNAAELET